MAPDNVQLMLQDVVRELVDKAQSAKATASQSGTDYDRGRQYAYYEVVSLLSQQAEAFGVDPAAIGLGGINPEHDLLD